MIVRDNYKPFTGRFCDRSRPSTVVQDSAASLKYNNIELWLKPSKIYDEKKFHKVTGMRVEIVTDEIPAGTNKLLLYAGLLQEIDIDAITWNNRPDTIRDMMLIGEADTITQGYTTIEVDSDILYYAASAFGAQRAFCVTALGDNPVPTFKSASLYYDYDDSIIQELSLSDFSPASGSTISGSSVANFTWTKTYNDVVCFDRPKQTSNIFEWRKAGSDVIYSFEDPATASSPYQVLPAGTFEPGETEWRVHYMTEAGQDSVTSWMTLTVTDGEAVATPVSPVGETVDAANDFDFVWTHSTGTGSAQTKFDIQISQNGTTWTDFASEETAQTSYTVTGGTLSAGIQYWRVRTYNATGEEGDWSQATMFVAIAAPSPPSIVILSTAPMWEIRWGADGQQAYELTVDGRVIVSKFGEELRYKSQESYEDGTYQIALRVQNQYGLWSRWTETQLTVVNVPGEDIVLTAEAGTNPEAILTWQSEGYDRYVVFRNGKKIGETTEEEFTDKLASGQLNYQVQGIFDETGNYGMSNSATLTISVEVLSIYDITADRWLKIELSEVQSRVLTGSVSKAAAFLHFAGTEKPSVEFGEAIDRVITFDCAFRKTDEASAAAFEEMLGHVVCMKMQTGETITGAMTAYSRKYTSFYRAYSSAITEAEIGEMMLNG